jgi:hypothetical protein
MKTSLHKVSKACASATGGGARPHLRRVVRRHTEPRPARFDPSGAGVNDPAVTGIVHPPRALAPEQA